MKQITMFAVALLAILCATGCKSKKGEGKTDQQENQVAVKDSAVYGTVGEGTMMHTLELVDKDGKTATYEMDLDTLCDIQGGVNPGDRITFTTVKGEEGMAIRKAINLTTLLGKWTALDRNFEIKEDGTVESPASVETNPYTKWSTCNARLILNTDTFDVVSLAPDSLALENDKGIFVYKRQSKEK